MSNRVRRYTKQIRGYSSFVPKKLPPEPPLRFDGETIRLLSIADRSLGRLDGVAQTLPNPDLFAPMYMKKEALFSSQINGVQTSLLELLEVNEKQTVDARKVTNYVNALNYGLGRLYNDGPPLDFRLLQEIHVRLLGPDRETDEDPDEFGTSQSMNRGYDGTLSDDAFIPPASDDMLGALDDLERYILDDNGLPPLVRIALIHAQFEIIHPFLDGNDRVGRILITLLLFQQRILSQPFLYLSQYFKRNRSEYYARLMAARNDGEWTDWIRFFLCGVIEIAAESSNSTRRIEALRQEALAKTDNLDSRLTLYSRQLIDQLFITPQVTYVKIEQLLQVTRYSAFALLCRFSDKLDILVDVTPDRDQGKRYLFKDYMDILEAGTA